MNTKTLYMVMGVEKSHDIDAFGRAVGLPLTWADGMAGVIPVFDSVIKARAYSAHCDIRAIETIDIMDCKSKEGSK